MNDRIERELVVDASPEEVWDAIVGDGWLADEVELDLRAGGDAIFRSARADQDRLGRGRAGPGTPGLLVGRRRRAGHPGRADAC